MVICTISNMQSFLFIWQMHWHIDKDHRISRQMPPSISHQEGLMGPQDGDYILQETWKYHEGETKLNSTLVQQTSGQKYPEVSLHFS